MSDPDTVWILIKDPSMEWDDPVEVYEEHEDALDAQEGLGAQLDADEVVTPTGRLQKAPYIKGGQDD